MKKNSAKSKPKTSARQPAKGCRRPSFCSGGLRSPLAKARDDWFETDEGKQCADASTLVHITYPSSFLRNRLELAFLAGAKFSQNDKGEIPT